MAEREVEAFVADELSSEAERFRAGSMRGRMNISEYGKKMRTVSRLDGLDGWACGLTVYCWRGALAVAAAKDPASMQGGKGVVAGRQ